MIFPHIGNNVLAFWGTLKFDEYMMFIMTDTRDGIRKGFCANASTDLIALMKYHDKLYNTASKYKLNASECGNMCPLIYENMMGTNSEIHTRDLIRRTVQDIYDMGFKDIAKAIKALPSNEKRIHYITQILFRKIHIEQAYNKPALFEKLIILLEWLGAHIEQIDTSVVTPSIYPLALVDFTDY